MFSAIYNLALIFFAWGLLGQYLFKGKYRSSLLARLGLGFPLFKAKPEEKVVWMHAVSMGEVRAMVALFHQIQPHFTVVISTTTETGLAEALRSMPGAKAHFILPLDFSWTMRRLIKQINPSHLILCESDFWLHLLTLAKAHGAKISLINGKVSERSCHRFKRFSFFTKRLFSSFDLICLQNEIHYNRFVSMGVPYKKLHVTGNLKLEAPVKKMQNVESFRSKLGITSTDSVLVIGSTHHPEEEELLTALAPLLPSLKILLVPRHPERFDAVASLLERKSIPYHRYSNPAPATANLILIDAMGQLNFCYQIANLAIVAGSYGSQIGGHNIFEPIQQSIPVFFGPHMHAQQELKDLVLSYQAGKEVPLDQLCNEVSLFFKNPTKYTQACQKLLDSIQGATQKTFDLIFATSQEKK
jgi:3-deoxy-D-manno-octulosonic-acid transferase